MEGNFDSLEEEFAALQRQDAESSQQIELQCEQLLQEFWHRYPPLKQVPEVILTTATLQRWLDRHPEKKP